MVQEDTMTDRKLRCLRVARILQFPLFCLTSPCVLLEEKQKVEQKPNSFTLRNNFVVFKMYLH